jgi:NDP-sugar pyrophosphorylase family protein
LVTRFTEKNLLNTSPGWINAGIYYFSARMAEKISKFTRGSIECDFLIPYCDQLQSFQISKGCFIDIGTPESYQKAPLVLQEYIK